MTLLPEPVEPAISRWGMDSRGVTLMRPLMSLPSSTVRWEGDLRNSSDSRIWRRQMSSRGLSLCRTIVQAARCSEPDPHFGRKAYNSIWDEHEGIGRGAS